MNATVSHGNKRHRLLALTSKRRSKKRKESRNET
jgi:hypothetical protein